MERTGGFDLLGLFDFFGRERVRRLLLGFIDDSQEVLESSAAGAGAGSSSRRVEHKGEAKDAAAAGAMFQRPLQRLRDTLTQESKLDVRVSGSGCSSHC